jgi:hypothetical protein
MDGDIPNSSRGYHAVSVRFSILHHSECSDTDCFGVIVAVPDGDHADFTCRKCGKTAGLALPTDVESRLFRMSMQADLLRHLTHRCATRAQLWRDYMNATREMSAVAARLASETRGYGYTESHANHIEISRTARKNVVILRALIEAHRSVHGC